MSHGLSQLSQGETIRRMREALEVSTKLFCDREDPRERLILAALALAPPEAEAAATRNAAKAELLNTLLLAMANANFQTTDPTLAAAYRAAGGNSSATPALQSKNQ